METGDYEQKPGDGDQKSTGAVPVEGTEEKEEDLSCGYICWRPECLQRCNTPPALLMAVCWSTFVQGFVVNGINNVNTASIERRFEMTSSEVAWISASYDIVAGVFSLVFGYIGAFVHNGICLTRNYTECVEDDSNLSDFLYVFIAGNMMHGIGGAAIYTISPPYMDANTKSKNLPVYLGWMLGFSALGPAVGFIVGGLLLNVYVDFGRVDMDLIDLTPEDPRWVGAWWLGYVIAGFMGITVALFMCCFPREFPVAKGYRKDKASDTYRGDGDPDKRGNDRKDKRWQDVMYSFKIIFCNPVWWFCTLGGTVTSGAVVGFAIFLPKIMQFQFSLTASQGAILAGLIVVPGAAGGQLLGGYTPKWFKLRVRGLLGQCMICSLVALALCWTFLFRCDMDAIAGVSVNYFNSTVSMEETDLDHACNENCSCTTTSYDPVCGADDVQYFTPCYAGCTNKHDQDENTVYYNCSCVADVTDAAVKGICDTECLWLIPFLCLLLVLMLAIFMANTSGQAASVRVLPERDRSFGFGIQACIIRWCGQVPAPFIFGALFDKSCIAWQEKCEGTGSCWIYNSDDLAVGLTLVIIIVTFFNALCFFLAFIIYKPPPEEEPVVMEVSMGEDNHAMSKVDLTEDKHAQTLVSEVGVTNATNTINMTENNYMQETMGDDTQIYSTRL